MKNLKLFIILFTLIFVSNGFSQKGDDIFPVELIYFQAQLTYNGVLLRWGTATELNNFGFEIQRADSTLQFIGIGFEPGHGTSNSPKHYFYLDSTLTDYGIYYYRLKQIDINGPYRYSDTVSIYYGTSSVKDVKSKGQIRADVFNNFREKELILELHNLSDKRYGSVTVYNIIGQKVMDKSFYYQNSPIKFSYKSLKSGVYFFVVKLENEMVLSRKFIVIR